MSRVISWREAAVRQRRRRRITRLVAALGGVGAALIGATLVVVFDWSRIGTPVAGLVDSVTQQHGFCNGAGWNCVIDGDTFRRHGETIRIADIDAPEVRDFKCAAEKALGDRTTARLRELLSAGPYELIRIDRDEDVYGRKLRIVVRGGVSLGEQLVAEGLARRWTGARRGWC